MSPRAPRTCTSTAASATTATRAATGPRSTSSTEARKCMPFGIPARSRGSAPRRISGRLISANGLPQSRQDAMKGDGRGLGDREACSTSGKHRLPSGVTRLARAFHFLKIPSLAKSFSTWEPLRRVISAIFVAPVSRRKPIAAFRMAAITWGPEPFRTRLASSPNVTSRT